MKAIETTYGGYTMRSQLEARYGTFFDALNEKWEYEKERFDLDDGDWYIPDFYLPRLECWVEVKGRVPNSNAIRKCRKLQFFTGKDVAIFHGPPMDNEGLLFGWTSDRGGMFTETCVQWGTNYSLLEFTDFPQDSNRLRHAAALAKQVRFEHGDRMPVGRVLENSVNYDEIRF